MDKTFPDIKLTQFYHCDKLAAYLNDESQPLPDLIFLDYNMPGNDGNQCLQWIKKTARLLNIPTIIYSTSSALVTIEQSYKYGAYKYLVKPSSFKEVKTTLEQVITEFEDESLRFHG